MERPLARRITAATRLLTGVRGKGAERAQVILLLTDGEDHQSDPLDAAAEAAKLGIRIYTVGIGSRSGEPIPVVDDDGTLKGYVKDAEGNPVTTRLDSETLKRIADATRGRYFEVDPEQFAVEPVVAEVAALKKSELEERLVRQYDEAFQWFSLAGLRFAIA